MRALLDGDLYAFRSAASAENDNAGIAIYRVEEMIDRTLAELTDVEEFSIFLSGDTNFRYQVYPEYKANRTPIKPQFLQVVKDYLIEKYKAQISVDCEADDLLGIEQCSAPPLSTIICSLDKDLRMIPGYHYSWEIKGTSKYGKEWSRPMEIANVTPADALRTFYTQLLVGDSTDNIKGAPGIGPVKAAAILKDCTTEQEMFEAVEAHYSSLEELEMNGQCLWIFRKPNDIWRIPTFDTTVGESQGT